MRAIDILSPQSQEECKMLRCAITCFVLRRDTPSCIDSGVFPPTIKRTFPMHISEKRFLAAACNWLCLLAFASVAAADEELAHRRLTATPFTAVKLEDAFWTPRLEINRIISLPHNIEWCEKTGRVDNFAKAGKLTTGKFEGIYFNDSDLYKVIEGASYSLAAQPDSNLDKTLDAMIAKIAAAQQPDGYLNTYFTLAEPGKRWSDLATMHELYCAGHLFEAAVAHHRTTGKRTLLDVAIRSSRPSIAKTCLAALR